MWAEGIQELENALMHCTNNDENNNEMDGVEVIDLCSVSQSKNETFSEGKESAKQESQDKSKHDGTNKMEAKLKTMKSKTMTKKDIVESAMMCWEPTSNLTEEKPHEEPVKVTKKPVEKTEKQYKKKSLYARRQVELFLDEKERSLGEERSFGESFIKEIEEDESENDGNITEEQKRLGIDINMIGARKETLGKTRSETKALSSPRNESMERADLTMEDWIQETCLISAVTSGPTEPNILTSEHHL